MWIQVTEWSFRSMDNRCVARMGPRMEGSCWLLAPLGLAICQGAGCKSSKNTISAHLMPSRSTCEIYICKVQQNVHAVICRFGRARKPCLRVWGQMQEKSYFDYDLISYTVATTVSASLAERSKDVMSKPHDNSWCVAACGEESIRFMSHMSYFHATFM